MEERYRWAAQVLSKIFQVPFDDILDSIIKYGNYGVSTKVMRANYFYGREFNAAGEHSKHIGFLDWEHGGFYFKHGAVEIVQTNSTHGQIYAILIDPKTYSVIMPLYIESSVYDGITIRLDNSQVPVAA